MGSPSLRATLPPATKRRWSSPTSSKRISAETKVRGHPRDAQRVVSQQSNWRESVLHGSHVCRKEKEHFLTPTRGKAELIGWARSHTGVGQRLGPRPMLLFMTLS